MIGGRHAKGCATLGEHFLPKFAQKDFVVVGNNVLGCPMQANDLLDEVIYHKYSGICWYAPQK